MASLLVVGARSGSLGESIAKLACTRYAKVHTAGISGEDFPLDATSTGEAWGLFSKLRPDHVVCTVGINEQCGTDQRTIYNALVKHFQVNCASVLNLMQCWLAHAQMETSSFPQFVAISSNSARIPRRQSAPYCASKAALSMALQCAAREHADKPVGIYGWEFGFIQHTPMSKQFEGTGKAAHRIPGDRQLDVLDAASMVVNGMMDLPMGFYANGNMIRVDGGEL